MYIKRTKISRGVFWGIVWALSLSCGAQIRSWTARDGTEFRGEFYRGTTRKFYFRGLDGQIFPVAATNLTDRDVVIIHSLIPPEVQIKFSKKLHEKTDYPPEYDSGNWDDHEIEVTGLVEIRKTSRGPYSGILRGEVYLIAKEVATDEYRLFAKKGFDISFSDQADGVQCQLMSTLRYFKQAGNEDRGAHYEGYVVTVSTAAGDRIAFSSNLSWMKEDKIPALKKIPVRGFMDEDCNRRSVPRPRDDREGGSESY